MSTTLKEYRKNHPKVKIATYVLYGAAAIFILSAALSYRGEAQLATYAENIGLALAAGAFVALWWARKAADAEYKQIPQEDKDKTENKSATEPSYWKLVVLGIALVAWKASSFIDGEGINHKLDVTQGYDEMHYRVSLTKATEKMTPDQISAFNWAVTNLDAPTLISRYGKSPTVREVVVGQANLAIETESKRIKSLEEKLLGMKRETEENEGKRQEALALLKTLVPKSLVVDYSLAVNNARKKNEGCKDIVCSSQDNEAYPPTLWYVLDNPRNLKLTSLPCTVTYQAKELGQKYTGSFDCVRADRNDAGQYYVLLSPGGKEDFSNGVATIAPDYANAKIKDPASTYGEVNALPATLREQQQVEEAKWNIDTAKMAKSFM